MWDAMKALAVGALCALLVVGAVQLGVLRVGWPSLGPLARDLVVQERTVAVEEAPTVTRVEAVSLDCRARIHATVVVTGTQEHRVAGVLVRTDEVRVRAAGDVDTCVDADAVTVVRAADGRITVGVPGEAIRFVRPRIDMTSEDTVITHDKGFLGELADLVPGGPDPDTLLLAALAHAQQVIGGEACMAEAFEVTSQALAQAYTDQLVAQGVDPSVLTVDVGEPTFDTPLVVPPGEDIEVAVDGPGPRCTMSADAHGGASPAWQDLVG